MLNDNLGPFIHLGLPVLNLAEVKEWYRDNLGYKIIHEPSLSMNDGTTLHISFLQKGEIMLEFYELTEDEISDYSLRKYGYIDHFSFLVDDLESAIYRLTKNGAEKINAENEIPKNDQKSQMVRGIYGEKLLIIESNDSAVGNYAFADVGVAYFRNKQEIINSYRKMGFEFVENQGDSRIFYLRFKNISMKYFWEPEEVYKLRNDGYFDHIAFEIKRIDDAYREVKSEGFPIIENAPVELPFWEKGIKYFNFRGPSGEKIELEQRLL